MKRIFSVSLDPAKRTNYGGIEVRFNLLQGKDRYAKTIEASNLDELAAQVEAFAKEYGQGCAAFVRVADGGRKPNGFDKRFSHLLFNLDTEASISTYCGSMTRAELSKHVNDCEPCAHDFAGEVAE